MLKMLNTISANDLKTRGVKLLEEMSDETDRQEVLVNVRGKTKYAILSIEYYNRLRELELEMALKESMEDIKAGRYSVETAEEHLKNISK
jgi:PHD/YefM family antitoxin component YafN of YafNO toxin-antitoxin module